MWPFKSNTQNEIRVTTKTWLIEAMRLEDEAKRIEQEAKTAYLRDCNPSLTPGDIIPWMEKACNLRMKALALRIYQGELPKEEEKVAPKGVLIHQGNVKPTALVIMPKAAKKKPTRKVGRPKKNAAKR